MKKIQLVCALLLLTTVAWSQQPKKIDNPRWKQVVLVKFHEGKLDRAMTIIRDYFDKSAKKANVPMPETFLRMGSGQWDVMLIWNLKGGLDDFNWETSADDSAWMKSLAEMMGGPEKSKALLDEYLSLIRTSQSEIGRVAL
jgi:hypothetical protein